MPFPHDNPLQGFQNQFVVDELNYDREQMASNLSQYLSLINEDQKVVFNEIINVVHSNKGGFYFVYG